jgi:hypothetical protein
VLKLPKPHAGRPLFLMAIGRAIGTATFSSKQILNSITAHSQNFWSKVTVVHSLAICLVSLRVQAAVRLSITVRMARNTLQLLQISSFGLSSRERRGRLLMQRSWRHGMMLLFELFHFIVTVRVWLLHPKRQYVLHLPLVVLRSLSLAMSLTMSEKLLHKITNQLSFTTIFFCLFSFSWLGCSWSYYL